MFVILVAAPGSIIAQKGAAQYVNLAPAFVTNYGSSAKIQYIKVAMSVRVVTADDAARVEYHQPLIRNNLLLLLHRQSGTELNSAAGRNQLRIDALQEIQQLMRVEEGEDVVSDVLFTNFVVEG